MTDRELLEAAARAAGYTLAWSSVEGIPPRKADDMETWDPLTDDGDALRLAVKMDLYIGNERQPYVTWWHGDSLEFVEEEAGDDKQAAVRRAIVRAAAEIGRAMK